MPFLRSSQYVRLSVSTPSFSPSLSVCLSTYLLDCLSLCQSFCLSVCLSVCVSVYSPSVCLSVYGPSMPCPLSVSLCRSLVLPVNFLYFFIICPFCVQFLDYYFCLIFLKHTVTRFFSFPCSPIRNTFRPGNGPRFCHQHDCCG